MAHKRPHSPTPTAAAAAAAAAAGPKDTNPEVYQSDPIHDRASVFIGLFSPTAPVKALQSHPTISAASHRIAAWRLPSKQRTLGNAPPRYDVGHDDDGEKGAGIRLGRLLEQEQVVGCAVVGRWWGGVMLGPVRFTWIENVAREAIVRWTAARVSDGSSANNAMAQQQNNKRIKTGEEAQVTDGQSRESLIEDLERRDRNIVVLRDLLREKKDKLEGASSPATSSPAKSVDYASMSMARLLALDKARDATMSHILKNLDKVDQLQKEEDELDAAFEKVAEAEEQKKDDAALVELEKMDKEEEDAQAFEEMERIAREIEDEAAAKEQNANAKPDEAPRTPERPDG